MKCAYHGANVTPLEHFYNWLMSMGRVTVEWGFGKIKMRNPFLTSNLMLNEEWILECIFVCVHYLLIVILVCNKVKLAFTLIAELHR